MKNVDFLLGTEQISNKPMKPYDDIVCDFIAEVSRVLMHDANAKKYPDILSFAFWCRKANILNLKNKHQSKEKRIGRGLVFQIAPSNVPVNFGFSCLFSMLAGNSNIVRLPSKQFPQIDIIISAFQKAIIKYPQFKNRISFIRYQHDEEITKEICESADGRIVWGGDKTVEMIRNIIPKPRCVDLFFPDRYSCAIIDGKAIGESDENDMTNLAKNFYNDTFLMDQNACSSPMIIFWRDATENDKDKFWRAVTTYAKQHYNLQPASIIDKFDQSCRDAINVSQVTHVVTYENMVYRILLNEDVLREDICNLRGSCGYFYECDLYEMNKILDTINEKYQTLTYFGVDPECLQNFIVNNGVRGIDRIVPIGKAMDIGVVWDGYDIVSSLSRIIALE